MPDAMPRSIQPMLATLVEQPFQRVGWSFEEKYDGDRILAFKNRNQVKLLSRNGKDRTHDFPAIVLALHGLNAQTLILDGEVVVFDRKHISCFQLLQNQRAQAVFVVFDCLYRNGRDLRLVPLSKRRTEMLELIGDGPILLASQELNQDGIKAFRLAKKRGLEGMIAKDLASPYREGRSRSWLKIKIRQEDEFLVVGYTSPGGSRLHFGALLLAAHDKGALRYVGKVGTGFSEADLASLSSQLRRHVRRKLELTNLPQMKDVVFTAPRLIAQIAYQEWTNDGMLRQPVFLGLRKDKSLSDVVLPRP